MSAAESASQTLSRRMLGWIQTRVRTACAACKANVKRAAALRLDDHHVQARALARRLGEVQRLRPAREARDVSLVAATGCGFGLHARVAEAVGCGNHVVELFHRGSGPEDGLDLADFLG